MRSLLEKLEKLHSDITEIMDEIRDQNQEDRPVDAKLLEMSNKEHIAQAMSNGPVKIIDEKGVYPEALNEIIRQQRSPLNG